MPGQPGDSAELDEDLPSPPPLVRQTGEMVGVGAEPDSPNPISSDPSLFPPRERKSEVKSQEVKQREHKENKPTSSLNFQFFNHEGLPFWAEKGLMEGLMDKRKEESEHSINKGPMNGSQV